MPLPLNVSLKLKSLASVLDGAERTGAQVARNLDNTETIQAESQLSRCSGPICNGASFERIGRVTIKEIVQKRLLPSE